MTTKTITSSANAKILNQFYTDPNVARDCIELVHAHYEDQPFDAIIEPSAGTGAFSRQLGDACIALDLDPKAPGIRTADFLTWWPEAPLGRGLVIGNPPFSDKAALKFLNHAAGFAQVVAFILPAIFGKKSQQNRVDPNMHLMHQQDIPPRSFSHAGKVVDVPCVFQIWERRATPRLMHVLQNQHPHFERCTQAEADLVIRRVGAHAGRLKPLGTSWSAQSNIFLRAVGCSRKDLLRRFGTLDLPGAAANGVGGGSINMTEIVGLYEAALTEEAAAMSLAAAAAPSGNDGESAERATVRLIPAPELRWTATGARVAERDPAHSARGPEPIAPLGVGQGDEEHPDSAADVGAATSEKVEGRAADSHSRTSQTCDLPEDFAYDVEGFEQVLRCEPIRDIWEVIGTSRDITRSTRRGEYGVLEISHGDESHALSLLLPFDETGALSGPGRIVSETPHSVIDLRHLDMELSREIWAEVADDIRCALPTLGREAVDSDDDCLPTPWSWGSHGGHAPRALS